MQITLVNLLTQTKYTELELNTSLSSNWYKACIYTLNVRSLSKIICRYFFLNISKVQVFVFIQCFLQVENTKETNSDVFSCFLFTCYIFQKEGFSYITKLDNAHTHHR